MPIHPDSLTRPHNSAAKIFYEIFLEHPHEAGETYGGHLWFTLKTSVYLILTAFYLTIHGLIPCFHTTIASGRVKALNNYMQERIKCVMQSRQQKSQG
ncbi:MAG: DUF6356 family protein [Alphaproteobacteria bacterium]|nr:DUF6356 family protein [Alphaproteobacteria bacterium]